jgi:hypothetical protein
VITEVTLSPADVRLARTVALARHGAALALGRRDSVPTGSDVRGFRLHVEGARGEIAFARMLGVDVLADWVDFVNCDLASTTGDVAGWEIRATAYRTGCLIIRPRDKPEPRYALLTTDGRRLAYRAAGWITGGDARRPEWWRNLDGFGPYAWCVPQTALCPFV